MKQYKFNIAGKIAGTLFYLVLFAMFSCTDDQEEYGGAMEPMDFDIVRTRATDTIFEEGDRIGIYAVESGQVLKTSGNYADNRQYTYRSGKFQPVSSSDRIYGAKGKSYVFHAYYPYQSGINPGSVTFDATGTTTKNRPLWSMNNRNSGSSVQLSFNNVFALIEVNISGASDQVASGSILNKFPKVTMDMCGNTLTTVKQNPTAIPLVLYGSSGSISTFRAFLPAGNTITAGDELFAFQTTSSESKSFYATKDMTTVAGERNVFSLTHQEDFLIKVTATAGGSITADAAAWATGKKFKAGEQCSIPFAANSGYFFDGIYENNIRQDCSSSPYVFNVTASRTLEVRFVADVITYGEWNVSVSATPTNIAATGGTSLITATAIRDIFTNGTKTGTETGTPSLSVSGSGFSLSGKTLFATENTGSSRSCTVTASYGGASKSCTVIQNAAVITYEYSLRVSPSFLSFSSRGEARSFTVTSTRTKIVNGTNTGVSENVNYTSVLSGADATGFTVSGTSVTASENPTTDFRDATITVTQTGSGKTATITLEQERKISIDTEI